MKRKINVCLIRGLVYPALLLPFFLFSACEKEIVSMDNDQIIPGQSVLKTKTAAEVVYELEGTTHFPCYAVKEHQVISPMENALACEATLTVEGHDMTLETREYFGGMLMRTVTFTGHISSGGEMHFSWPDTWWEFTGEKGIEELDDQILEHTGCIIYGPGNAHGTFRLNYKGKFDGTHFSAAAPFMGKQVQFGTVDVYSEEALGDLVEGPIQFDFSIELDTL